MRRGVITLVLIGEILHGVMSITLNVIQHTLVILGRTLVFNQVNQILITKGGVSWHLGCIRESGSYWAGASLVGYIINH